MNDADVVVAIECCRDCKQHQWNTRHDETRYQHFFAEFQKEAKALVGSATFALNHVPTRFLEAEPFKTLNLTDAPSEGFQPIRPRIGAFEIYLQSYLATGLWPHIPSVVRKLQKAVEAIEEGKDVTEFAIEIRKQGNSAARSSASPVRNRSNSRSQNITPLRSSYKSPKPFKNASPVPRPPRAGPPMIQNNIAIIHGYQGPIKGKNEEKESSIMTKNSQKSLQEPLAKTIIETKGRPMERRQSNEEKEEVVQKQEASNQEKMTAEAVETEGTEKEEEKQNLPPLDDNVSDVQATPVEADVSISNKDVTQSEDKPQEQKSQEQNNESKYEEFSEATQNQNETQVEKTEEDMKAQSVKADQKEEPLPIEQEIEANEDKKEEIKAEQSQQTGEEDYTFEKEEPTQNEENHTEVEKQQESKQEQSEVQQNKADESKEKENKDQEEQKTETKEEEEKQGSEEFEKRDTLEQLPSQKPSKMSINEFKREESSERYEESFDQSESMNESTVAQRLAMATIDRAKESIKNQMEVQTEDGSTVSKKATAERVGGYESGPLSPSKIEEEGREINE